MVKKAAIAARWAVPSRGGFPLTGKWALYGFGLLLAIPASCLWFRIVLWSAVPFMGAEVDKLGRDALFTRFMPTFALLGALTWWFSALGAWGKSRYFSRWGYWGMAVLSGTSLLLGPIGIMGLLCLPLALIISILTVVRVMGTRRQACDLLVIPFGVFLAAVLLSYLDPWWELFGD